MLAEKKTTDKETEKIIQTISSNDPTLADMLLNEDDVDKEVLKFLAENAVLYSSDIGELVSGHAKLEWYILYHSNKEKEPHVRHEIINAFKDGLSCDYVTDYMNETNDLYEMEQRRLAYRKHESEKAEGKTVPAKEADVNEGTDADEQDTAKNDVNMNEKPHQESNKWQQGIEGEGAIISNFITSIMNLDMNPDNEDETLNETILKNVTSLVNLNRKRNKENFEQKKALNMYQGYCISYDEKIKKLKEEIDRLTLEVAQKDAVIKDITHKNEMFNIKLEEIRKIQGS